MNKLKSYIVAIAFAVTVGGASFAVLPATTANAAATAPNCSGTGTFLTFPAWYRGLATPNNTTGGCDSVSPEGGNLGGFIWHIVLNVIEIGLQLVGYAAFGFILFAGFQYMTSAGDPAQSARARQTIFNAAIGIFISFASVAVVNLVVGIIPK
jgi:hypothetical protein